ncbi:hypothetical protein COB52_02520 [Candidatus Kaiserbacteria bacterium]|nr:MAG: hypothetical protein COB52_02520 [Candidatus Kaiserbacteria bacterium]
MASEAQLETWTDTVAMRLQEAKSNDKRLNPVTAARKVVKGAGIFDKRDLIRLGAEIQRRLTKRSIAARKARKRPVTSDMYRRQVPLFS